MKFSKLYKSSLFRGVMVSSVVALAASCSGNRDGWMVSGTVKDGGDKIMYIERQSGNSWLLLDSVKIGGDGSFSYSAEMPGDSRTVYALRLEDRRIVLLPDSTEELMVVTAAGSFNNGHKVTGNASTEGIAGVDSIISDAVKRVGAAAAVNDSQLLQALGSIILTDTTGNVTYYVMTADVEGNPIFNIETLSKLKIRLLGAAANRFTERFPNDPRTQELTGIYKSARNLAGMSTQKGVSMEATVSGRPEVDFVRPDFHGTEHDLNKVLDRGGVTIVNFIRFDHPSAPAVNLALREAYNKYKDQGLEIYQISFDPNRATWNQTAPSLPWTVVYNSLSDPADILVSYMVDPVSGAPVSFIVDRDGEIVARVEKASAIGTEVARLF
ncbi:MAG: redoxin domain-containing protein [Muribaculaceae bacterium]|nr:redoxin domain-containing protein [Muribaculaceae bacterium]